MKNVLQNNLPLTAKRINGNTELSYSPTHLVLGSKWEKAFTEDPPTHQWVFPLTTGAYGVVASMFDFHHSDLGSNTGRGGKIS